MLVSVTMTVQKRPCPTLSTVSFFNSRCSRPIMVFCRDNKIGVQLTLNFNFSLQILLVVSIEYYQLGIISSTFSKLVKRIKVFFSLLPCNYFVIVLDAYFTSRQTCFLVVSIGNSEVLKLQYLGGNEGIFENTRLYSLDCGLCSALVSSNPSEWQGYKSNGVQNSALDVHLRRIKFYDDLLNSRFWYCLILYTTVTVSK